MRLQNNLSLKGAFNPYPRGYDVPRAEQTCLRCDFVAITVGQSEPALDNDHCPACGNDVELTILRVS